MDSNDTIRTAWGQVRRERFEVRRDVVEAQHKLAVAVAREAKLAQAEDALRALLDFASSDVDGDDESSRSLGSPRAENDEKIVEEDAEIAAVKPAGVALADPDPPRRHVRSGALVVEAVKAGGGIPVHREEVLRHFEEAGATGGMKNPRNAVNAALNRAVNDHRTLVQISPDTFLLPQHAPSAAEFMSPEAVAADRLRESAEGDEMG